MKVYYNEKDLIIRSMKISDIEAFPIEFTAQGWDKPKSQFEEYFKEQEDKVNYVIVAEKHGKVAGYVKLYPQAQGGPYANKGIPEIVDFNVLIKYQKQGVGNKMLDIAENIAKETSNYVSLGVGLHYGYGSAQRMYVKRGYIPDGSGVWYNDKQLEQYVPCCNDDGLILYLLKEF